MLKIFNTAKNKGIKCEINVIRIVLFLPILSYKTSYIKNIENIMGNFKSIQFIHEPSSRNLLCSGKLLSFVLKVMVTSQ